MNSRIKRLCLILIMLVLSSCSSKEEDANFTGTFEYISGSGLIGIPAGYTFELTQHKTRIAGRYHYYIEQRGATYHVAGRIHLPDSDVAELVLTLVKAYPDDYTPEKSTFTLHIMLTNDGDSIYVSEREQNVPRVKNH